MSALITKRARLMEMAHQCDEHEPVVPSNRFHDDSSAVESRSHEYDREDCQRDLNTKDEWSLGCWVVIVWRRPFEYVFKRGKC